MSAYSHGGGGYCNIFKVDRLFTSTPITSKMIISNINIIDMVSGTAINDPPMSASSLAIL